MQGLLRDVRHSARVLRRAPALTLTAIVTIGIGAGANATVASFIDALLFRTPAGVRAPSQLVSIYSADFSSGPYGGTSTPDYMSMAAETTAFSGIAASRDDPGVILSMGTNVERVSRSEVTANFFDVIGLRPTQGRFFGAVDEAPGAAPTAIVGYALWKRLFQAGTSPLGAPVTFAGTTYTIIGVAPEGFEALDLSRPREIWTLLPPASSDPAQRGNRSLTVIARLRPDADRRQAQRELDALAERLASAFPATNRGTLQNPDRPRAFTLTPYTRVGARFRSQVTAIGAISIAASILLLVIAAANVGNLLLARSAARQRELAIRVAIGASRARIVNQLLIESVLLGLMGGAAGLLIALGNR